MTDLFFAAFPVVLLVYLMTKKNALPAHQALPLSAFLVYLFAFTVFNHDPNLIHATVLSGLLKALTPILIIAGAIFLFKAMEATGGLAIIKHELNKVSENTVAQLMILGWAFPFLIEGASGFGTPAAIAAPILVGLGFNPLRVATLALIMNSVPVSFGAVGTPTWFGFSGVELTHQEQLTVGFRSALIHSIIALVVPLLALRQIVAWQSIIANLPFILLSIICTVVPYALIAAIDYEFPSLIGGVVGLLCTILLAHYRVGLSSQDIKFAYEHESQEQGVEYQPDVELVESRIGAHRIIKATFPIWGTLLLLIITRIPELGIKGLLTSDSPALVMVLGSLGEFSISASLVVGLDNIYGTSESWQHSVLYVPSILPFAVIVLMTFFWNRTPKASSYKVCKDTVIQMQKPSIALGGALIFVSLMMLGDEGSAVNQIGNALADLSGESWLFVSPYLGALGSFFSGSATISNLTFGAIQNNIAVSIGLDRLTVLALQSVGGSMGNMVCINNIVAVCSILALEKSEGKILKQTFFPMMIYGFLAGILAWVIF